jgi:transglutaminase-like putative cysteine protease
MKPAPQARLYGICAIAIVVALVGAEVARRSRLLPAILAVLGAVGMLAVAGIPLEWIRHLRIAVTADAIGQGLTALPDVLVPYLGINEWVRVVIVLGAGVLLLDAAALAALLPRHASDLRRASAALPLVALAIVPATIVKPGLPYLQGLVLFALLAAFMWGDRLAAPQASGSVALLSVVSVLAIVIAPRIDPGSAWVDYQSLAGSLSLKNVDRFDWTQRYGPLNWPRDSRTVFSVKAAHPDYWKIQNLDVFDGRGWAAQAMSSVGTAPPPSPAATAKWTQSIQVTIGAMKTPYVIAAGTAAPPVHVPEGYTPGISPGTWVAGSTLGPGASYTVRTYSPHPSAEQLAAVTADKYSVAQTLPGDLSIDLPAPRRSIGNPPVVQFGAFHSPIAVQAYNPPGQPAVGLIDASPYGRVFALARRLAGAAPTPYAYVESVMRYLAHGFSYSEHPPPARYPLTKFLFASKLGYCQQFAGAMALLLRMGGIPARVAVGFTPGTFDKATGEWQVNDFDAHAWVEAWFPTYGWVRFDPTPASAPARGGGAPPILKKQAAPGDISKGLGRRGIGGDANGAAPGGHTGAGGSDVPWIILALVVVAGIGGVLVIRRTGEQSVEQLLAELERAFRRSGRPLADGITLAALEERLRGSRDAQGYVRALRMQRFARAPVAPTLSQRRAVRRHLALGAGTGGRLRALWALPPRPAPRARTRHDADVQSM